jgi:hypothetical protein
VKHIQETHYPKKKAVKTETREQILKKINKLNQKLSSLENIPEDFEKNFED